MGAVDTGISVVDTGIYKSVAISKGFKYLRYLIKSNYLPNCLRDILSYFELYIKNAPFKTEVRRELLFYHNHWREIQHTEGLEGLFFIGGLLECVSATETIEGNIIELGTYKGGTALIIARFLKNIGSKKRIYACDTFEGHPYNDEFGKDKKDRFSDVNVSCVEDKFRRFGVADKIRIIKGKFEDMLHKKLRDERFSFAFLDCDLYQSTKCGLDFLIPRMADGAIIALHDYGNPKFGLSKAVRDQCKKNHLKVNLYPIPHIHLKWLPVKHARMQISLRKRLIGGTVSRTLSWCKRKRRRISLSSSDKLQFSLRFKNLSNYLEKFIRKNIVNHTQVIIYEKNLTNIPSINTKIKVNVKRASLDDIEKMAVMHAPNKNSLLKRLNDGHLCLIAERKGDAVGYCWVAFQELYVSEIDRRIKFNNAEACLYAAFVFPEHRRKRIYQKMLVEIFRFLRKNGYKKAFINVLSDNIPSQRGVEHVGFRRIKNVNFFKLFGFKSHTEKRE